MLQLPLARINLNFRLTEQPLSCGVQTKFVPRGASSSSANLAHISGNLSFQTLGTWKSESDFPFPIHLVENKSIPYQQFHHPFPFRRPALYLGSNFKGKLKSYKFQLPAYQPQMNSPSF
jgi:hypothetical protein